MKGIASGLDDSGGGGGLKGLDGVAVPSGLKDAPTDSGLKGLDPQPAQPAPVVLTDSRVVDARNVPSGLKKTVEDAFKKVSNASGVYERLRKGLQAFDVNDFEAAKAYYQDALNHDPNNEDLKEYVVMVLSIINGRMEVAKKLSADPGYNAAINQGVAAIATGDAAAQNAAVEKMRKAGGTLQLSTDKDMTMLFPPDDEEKIRNGDALPVHDEKLNKLIKEHPELYPQLCALWKETCNYRLVMQSHASDFAVESVDKLSKTAARMGLPYGHIEETLAKNPKLKAEWNGIVTDLAEKIKMKEDEGLINSQIYFDNGIKELSRSADKQKNPYNLFEPK